MPHADHRRILCGMKNPPDPQHRPAALDEFGLVATGITALVAKRILETNDDAMSATKAPVDPARPASGHEPNPLPTHTAGTEHGLKTSCHAALHDLSSSPQTAPALSQCSASEDRLAGQGPSSTSSAAKSRPASAITSTTLYPQIEQDFAALTASQS
jgi:hypothetical protein